MRRKANWILFPAANRSSRSSSFLLRKLHSMTSACSRRLSMKIYNLYSYIPFGLTAPSIGDCCCCCLKKFSSKFGSFRSISISNSQRVLKYSFQHFHSNCTAPNDLRLTPAERNGAGTICSLLDQWLVVLATRLRMDGGPALLAIVL